MILDFNKPKKVRSTKDHNNMFSSDSGIAGTYVSNMSKEDEERFKAKYIKGIDERIEIRVSFGVNVLIKVFLNKKKTESRNWQTRINDHEDVQMSMNGKLDISFKDWEDIMEAIAEAREILKQ